MATAGQIVEASLFRAAKVYSSGAGGLLTILKEADTNLSKRLHGLVRKAGGPNATFTEASFYLHRKQIRLVTDYLEKRLVGYTHEQAMSAVKRGVAGTVRLAKRLERKFTGIARPLALESVAMQDVITRGVGASLLRQHQSSVNRYSKAMIGDFERVMKVGALEGLSQHQVISRLVRIGELSGINAAALHANEPAWFPDPTGYVDRRYWAERILRTETAYALNAASLGTIQAVKVNDFPDMQKKILAHFDMRTAPDSIAVHGQVRPVDGYFQDGAGRQYLHPPARPNDRETVVPWRPAWGEIEETRPAPVEEQRKAAQTLDAKLGPRRAERVRKAKARAEGIQPAKPRAPALLPADEAVAKYAERYRKSEVDRALKGVFGSKRAPGPEWWAEAFRLPKGYTYRSNDFTFDRYSKVKWQAGIYDEQGKYAGTIQRSFISEGGQIRVKHDLLKIDSQHQGKGIGASVLAHGERVYEQLGVKRIKVEAAWDGRAVWARYGFEWQDEDEAEHMVGQFRDWLQREKGLPQTVADQVASSVDSPLEILRYEHGPPAKPGKRPSPEHVHPWEYGREFLLQADVWSGKIDRNGGPAHKLWKERLADGENKLREQGRWQE